MQVYKCLINKYTENKEYKFKFLFQEKKLQKTFN